MVRIALSALALFVTAASGLAAGVTGEIRTFQFHPGELTIEAGQSVAFTNHDAIPHSVTAEPANGTVAFDTGLFGQDETRTITPGEPGVYEFYCTRHPSMRGRLIVE